jgi:hypothetical protein
MKMGILNLSCKKRGEKVQYGMTKDLIIMQCTALETAIEKLQR